MSKLDYIATLSGRCPEGMVVEKYLAGGCVKCAKKKADLMACGGSAKKRIKKSEQGSKIDPKYDYLKSFL